MLHDLVLQITQANVPEHSLDNIRRLGELWHPESLDVLAETVREIVANGINLSGLFIRQVAEHLAQDSDFPMANRLNQVSDLQLLIKCRVDDFIPASCELLTTTSEFNMRKLCEWAWIAGDARAEVPLLSKLHNYSGKEDWYCTYTIMRALGTCGGLRAKEAILLYLREGGEIALDFYKETLYPLLYRRELLPVELSTLLLDPEMPKYARMCSLSALSVWDAPAQHEVIHRIASDSTDAELQAHAVRQLYFTKDTSVISFLQSVLRDRESHLTVKAQAAIVLSWMNNTESLRAIEDQCRNIQSPEVIEALSRFQSESSLNIILTGIAEAGFEKKWSYIQALGAYAHLLRGKTAIQEQFENWARGKEDHRNTQSHLISGLAEHHPEYLLETIIAPYDKKQLHAQGRMTLAKEVRQLIIGQSVEGPLLLALTTRLISDEDSIVRETVLQGLAFATPGFCQSLFEKMWSDPKADEWSRAATVTALGYWQDDEQQIEKFRYDSDLLVRKATDIALMNKSRRSALRKHVDRFQSMVGIERLSSWLCLQEQGDWATAKQCADACNRGSLLYAFRSELSKTIVKNDERKMEKRKRDEQFFKRSRGVITFD